MDLPEITEVKRIRYQPGDRFLVRCELPQLSQEQAGEIRRSFRSALMLPDDVPVAIIADGIDVEIVAPAVRDELDYFIPASEDGLE